MTCRREGFAGRLSAGVAGLLLFCLLITERDLAAQAAIPTTPPSTGTDDSPASPVASRPFRFGLIADVQYADKPDSGGRHYRDALPALKAALHHLDAAAPAFVVHLGDIIDGNGDLSVDDLEQVLGTFAGSRAPVRHVVGNHCLEVARPVLLPRLGLSEGYYAFRQEGWLLVVLDTMEISLKAPLGSPELREAQQILAAQPGLATYNGAVGDRQLAWLHQTLGAARREGQRALLFSHHPLATLPERSALLAWNASAVRSVIEDSRVVAACFSGHDHAGAYRRLNGVHYLTLPGLVEAAPGQTRCAVVDVRPDRIEIKGIGDVGDHGWPLGPH